MLRAWPNILLFSKDVTIKFLVLSPGLKFSEYVKVTVITNDQFLKPKNFQPGIFSLKQ